jgi:thymidylate synthase (FAD)
MTREQLLAKYANPILVGPHGHVRLVDVMGDDAAIVQAARVSYGKGTKTVNEDRGLVRYLIRHRHTTPLEMCVIKFHLKMPIHVARQHIRHRMSSTNEYSTRYSEVADEFEIVSEFRSQSTTNKQGSGDLVTEAPENFLDTLDYNEVELAEDFANGYCSLPELLEENVKASIRHSYQTYQLQRNAGVAREQARNVLPLATYTEMYWKIDLHNLFHYLKLRMDPHAQKEIRELAQAMYEIVKDWVPVAAEAFEDYSLNAVTFSRQELEWLREALNATLKFAPKDSMIDSFVSTGITNKREQQEFLTKLGLS